MAKKKPEQLEFASIGEVVEHLDRSALSTTEAIKTYRSQVQELTGHNPDQPVTPVDVVKIVLKAFPQLGQAT